MVDDKIWESMKETYHKMGFSEEEIGKRILCKTTRVIDGTMHLDECDENS